MNPTDLAHQRWRPIKKAFEAVEEAERAQAGSRARVEGLRAQIGPAEHRDRLALGTALVAGKDEPESEADTLRADLEREERHLDALNGAVESARQRIPKVVEAHGGAWRGGAEHALARAKSRYLNAIAELEAAREALNNEATLLNWLSSGDISQAATDALGGRSGNDPDGRPVMAFTRTLEELRRDCEHLANHPGYGHPQPEPRFERAHGPGVRGMRVSEWGGSG